MAFGDNKHDDELRAACHDFCEHLKQVGEIVFEDPAPAEDIDRASGLQYIARNISTGFDIELEHADPLFPNSFGFSRLTVSGVETIRTVCGSRSDSRYRIGAGVGW
jgi:hypothetical protein